MNEKTVKRYDIFMHSDDIQFLREDPDGDYVRFSALDAVVAERDEALRKNDTLVMAYEACLEDVRALRLRLSDQATYGAEQLGKLNQRVRDLEGETFRLRGVVMEKNTALSAAWAEMAVLENKLRPRLTKNEPPTEADAVDGMVLAWSPDERQDFWAEYGWKQVAELDQSSGDVSFKYWMPYPDRPEWPISALSPPSPLKGEES